MREMKLFNLDQYSSQQKLSTTEFLWQSDQTHFSSNYATLGTMKEQPGNYRVTQKKWTYFLTFIRYLEQPGTLIKAGKNEIAW